MLRAWHILFLCSVFVQIRGFFLGESEAFLLESTPSNITSLLNTTFAKSNHHKMVAGRFPDNWYHSIMSDNVGSDARTAHSDDLVTRFVQDLSPPLPALTFGLSKKPFQNQHLILDGYRLQAQVFLAVRPNAALL